MKQTDSKRYSTVIYVIIRCGIYERYYLRLEGLDPNKRYLNGQTGQVLTGKAWMNAGICLHERLQDHTSRIFHLVDID